MSFLSKHFGVIILAFFVAVLSFGPQLLAIYKMGDNFQGIYPINTADDIYYLARSQDIIDGHIFLSNPYLYEHKDSSPMQFWLPDFILAQPMIWLDISPPIAFIIYDFLLVFILVVLSYLIFYKLTLNRPLALIFSSFLHLGLFLSDFARSPSPQFNFIFCLLLFLFLIEYIRKKRKIYLFLASISFGLLFHVYTYYWTFFVVLFAIFSTAYLLRYKKINWHFLGVFLGALLIGLPYFFSLFQAMQLPFYEESIYRLGMIDTHFPSGIKIVLLFFIAIISAVFFYKNKIIKINELSIFLISSIIAAAISVNQHVITGKNLEFSSHYWMIAVFSFSFLVAYLFNKILQNKIFGFSKKNVYIILFVVVICFSFWQQKNKVLADINPNETELYWQNYKPIFDWLNNNTAKDSVVFANNDLSTLIPVYTKNNIYYNRFANLFFISDQEVQERFVINNYWEEFDDEFIYDKQRSIWGVHYIDAYGHNTSKNILRKFFNLPPQEYEKIPKQKIDEFVLLAEDIQSGELSDYLFNYRVDYFVWDKNKNPNWQLDNLDFLEEVYFYDNFFIYKIIF